MNLLGVMSPKLKLIQNRPTKQSRKNERRKVGALSALVVQPRTQKRYHNAFKQFCQFHNLSEAFVLPDFHLFDEWVADYVEQLWEEGSPKSEASYALAAIQFFRPQAKNHLVWSWKLVKTWNQVELPTRATPLTPELLLSMAGQAFHWRQHRFGWLLVLGFSAFLRTSELINLERKAVILPEHGRPREAVLLLTDTKGTKKSLLPLDKTVLDEQVALQALQYLCSGLQPGDTLSQMSNKAFRTLFQQLLEALSLQDQGYRPYSLRRGGVTSAYRQGVPLDVLVTKGRWQHLPTARLYIDAGLQSLAQISHPPQTLRLCAKMRQCFRTVSQDGARGMKAGKCQSRLADPSK